MPLGAAFALSRRGFARKEKKISVILIVRTARLQTAHGTQHSACAREGAHCACMCARVCAQVQHSCTLACMCRQISCQSSGSRLPEQRQQQSCTIAVLDQLAFHPC